MDKINLQVVRESFGRVVWTHKTHEKSVEIEEKKAKKTKWCNICLTGLTFLSFVASILFSDQNWFLYISAVLLVITLSFTVYLLSFNPEKKSESHRYTAKELWLIREKYVNLIADIMNERVEPNIIEKRRDQLTKDSAILYKFAPQTSPEAYEKASNALKLNEELTFSNDEINSFLPKDLHITN